MDFKAAETNGGWIALLTTIVPFIIIFILFFFLINQAQGGGGGGRVMNFGKSKARLYDTEKKKITFDDVAGAEQAKLELQREILEKALQKSEEILKNKITAKDQEKLVDEYLEKVVA